MTKNELAELMDKLPRVRVAVVGDFCLDVYWTMDDGSAERSVETGLATRPVRGQRCSLGGAGTVVNNLRALGVGCVATFGMLGDDPFGREMRRILEADGVDCAGLLSQKDGWDTPVYIKPIRDGREENRLDFGNYNQLQDENGAGLVARLRAMLPELDAVIVNQQLRAGIHTPKVQGLLNDLFRENQEKIFVVDARHLAGVYEGCVLKVNDFEATTLCGGTHQPGDVIMLDEVRAAALQLAQQRRKPVIVTRGARGCLVVDAAKLETVAGLHIVNPIDTVGAGESSPSAAELTRNDQRGEIGLPQALNVGKGKGGRPVVFGGRLGELARKRRGGDVDVVGAPVEDHRFSSAAISRVKIGLTIVVASRGLGMSPERA